MDSRQYKYARFKESVTNHGYLVFDGTPDAAQIKELCLEEKHGYYYSTLNNIGMNGWQLKFVSSCGEFKASHGGSIINAFVFEKIVESSEDDEMVEFDW